VSYEKFVESKVSVHVEAGIEDVGELAAHLYPYQREIVTWALKRGRAAVFADCGLGKTPMQLEWARHVQLHTGGVVMIIAPLAVVPQTVREGAKFGVPVKQVRAPEQMDGAGIYAVNYDVLEKFTGLDVAGVVLDESSILKNFTGTIRNQLVDMFSKTPYRLACTATPAPNDHTELANHAEFLGILSRAEMLATYFINDTSDTGEWRLKGHAEGEFWRWMASWSVAMRRPQDLGYDVCGFDLPPLTMREHIVAVDHTTAHGDGLLFRIEARGLSDLRTEMRDSAPARAAKVAELVAADPDEAWVIWCHTNAEADLLVKSIPGAVEVRGSDDPDEKADKLNRFSSGDIKILVTKPSIAGFGMNWQHCARVAFVGLSHSWEQWYQAVRRCWRHGQTREVMCHIVAAETEGAVVASIKSKQAAADEMAIAMIGAMAETSRENVRGVTRDVNTYERDIASGKGWTMHLGDCVDVARGLADESIDASIFSPPFSSLFTYSNSPRDMGNCKDDEVFFEHFGFLIDELYRAMKPGRIVMIHCMNLMTTKWKDGYTGVRDFRGEIIKAFCERGFIYHSEVCIWKDPVTAMQRTKAHGLLYKTLRTDSAASRQGLPDYLVIMRKPGVNPKPITHTPEDFPLDDWQEWASPVWMDIDQTDVLSYREAREVKDERHICPLQLGLIRKALRLWSAPDDLVFSPFGGIGSEGYVSLEMGRRFIGAELKRSYWSQAVATFKRLDEPPAQVSLF
jgi:superfamily II DNA or RNA helicase